MATTTIGVNHPLAVKAWAKDLSIEVSKATAILPLIGKGANSIIQLKDETSKSAGDAVTFGLRYQLTGDGVTEGQMLEGKEEALSTGYDKVLLNELAHAVRVKNQGTIDAQRVPYNLRQEAKAGLADWYADRLSLMFFLHVCGYTGKTITFEGLKLTLSPVHYGFNAPTAPSDRRVIRAGGKATDEALTKTDTFNLSLIDKAVERAKLSNPKIRPVRVDGDKVYVMYLHPTQVTSLRTNTDQGQWLDINKAVYSTSRKNNPIFNGSLGMYNGVILRESEHITTGLKADGTEIETVRRAVLLGAQSGVIAYGQKTAGTRYDLVEELFDYQRELGVAAKAIIGMKKTQFKLASDNSVTQDFATIVVPTWAEAS